MKQLLADAQFSLLWARTALRKWQTLLPPDVADDVRKTCEAGLEHADKAQASIKLAQVKLQGLEEVDDGWH